jgi:putative ABC transport system substrate-binding protein
MRPIGLAVLLSLTFAPLAVEAQLTRTPRIGFLSNGNPTTVSPQREAFRRGLRELGWIEGQTVTIEYRWADGNSERLPTLAVERSGQDGAWRGSEAPRRGDAQSTLQLRRRVSDGDARAR